MRKVWDQVLLRLCVIGVLLLGAFLAIFCPVAIMKGMKRAMNELGDLG